MLKKSAIERNGQPFDSRQEIAERIIPCLDKDFVLHRVVMLMKESTSRENLQKSNYIRGLDKTNVYCTGFRLQIFIGNRSKFYSRFVVKYSDLGFETLFPEQRSR